MSNHVHRLDLDGAIVAYRASSPPRADQVATLILGGAFANVFSFQLVEHALSEFGAVILVDLPGAGLAGVAPPGFTQADALRVLLSTINHLAISRMRIVAICNGAPVAHALAATIPERIDTLILGSSVLDPVPRHRLPLERLCEALDTGNATMMSDRILRMLMGDVTHPEVHRGNPTRALLATTLRETPPEDMERMASSLRMSLAPWPERPRYLTGVRSFAYTGEFDPYTTVADCLKTSAAIEDCSAFAIRNADHMVHIERPRELAELFRHIFLNEPVTKCDFAVSLNE